MTLRPVITLLTDFGTADPWVGMMKGVIAGICPGANVIDLTHEIPPQDVRMGAFYLERSWRFFPSGTVHLAVVDPGVGTARTPIAAAAGGHIFVGPDNGLLSLAAPRGRAFALTGRSFFLPAVSNTFHGRDVFAPVAAHLAAGISIDRVGVRHPRMTRLAWPKPRRRRDGALAGEIVAVDRFGNLITNIEPSHWSLLKRPELRAGSFVTQKLSSSYQGAREGASVAVFDGYGLLEIAVRNGSAADSLRLHRGDQVIVHNAVHK